MRVIDILRKDLKIILSDRKALATMILMPIILCTILSFALSGSFIGGGVGNLAKFQIAIVKEYNVDENMKKIEDSLNGGFLGSNLKDDDKEQLIESAKGLSVEEIFFDKFLENDELKKVVEYRVEDRETAMELLENKEVAGVVVLPENFIYDMTINFITPFRNIIDIEVFGNAEYTIGAQVTEGIVSGFTDMVSSMIIGKNVFIETALEEGIGQTAFEDMETIINGITDNIESLRIDIEYLKLEGKNPVSSFQYYAAAMGTMFILFAAGYGSRTLLEEKDNMTYQRMVMAGTAKWKIVAGKFFMIFVFSFLQITIMILYSSIILKVNWGNTFTVAIISIFTMFAVAGLGTMIGVATFKSGNYKMSVAFDSVIIQIMALVGGSFIPLEILPKFMQRLSILSINGIALKSYLKAMMGYGIGELKIYLLVLLGLGTVFISLAIFILRRKEGAKHA
ncbi:ABC transporter permease [Wukongibacter baidiensis]|uniref:ABC transporter permease n=1 Tax=Wukongibacter baidiensis TaxID=1723361 RepID=UPI003D7F6FEA